ncbi:MAG TPA: hypothetical protein VF665_07820 [Longimicrobium sp.]|uniref:hypothetical protein n=1 Tax=Longimicrobium sp. TaxID=2029185 RepID=UPI002ED82BF9
MANSYQIRINIAQDSVIALEDESYSLYAFKAVKSKEKGGRPTVWFQTGDFGLITKVKWTEQFQAFTSRDDIQPNVEIDADNPYLIDLGQTLKVQHTTGVGVVEDGGTAGAVGIANGTAQPMTCGLAQQNGEEFTPLAAFPLNGNHTNVIAPIEKVLLMFATEQVRTSTVIEKAFSSGVLVDLTGVSSRVLNYDINKGWSWDEDAAWAQQLPANVDLVPIMIETM